MLFHRSHRSRKSASRKRRRTHGQLTHQRKALFEQLEDRRLLAAGGLDLSFGGDGKVTTDIGRPGTFDNGEDVVAYQSDGKSIVVGESRNDMIVLRYNTDGSLDTTFADHGIAKIDFGGVQASGYSVAVDSEDRVLVGGQSFQGGSNGWDFAVARLTTNGELDTNFDSDGKVTTDIGRPFSRDNGQDVVAYQSDGKLIFVGNSGGNIAVVRYNADGIRDTTFAGNGIAIIDFGTIADEGYSVAVDSADRVLVGGRSRQSGGYVFAVARLTTTGALDTSFDTDGKQTIDFGNIIDQAFSVAVDSAGRVLLGGYSIQGGSTGYDFAVARLTTSGMLDTSFDTDGKQTIDFGNTQDIGGSVAVDSAGRVLLGGYSVQGGGSDFAVARLIGNTNAPPVADAGGPYALAEGGSIQLDASASTDPDQDSTTLTYEWDLDDDGVFGETGATATHGDEVGVNPIFSAAGLDGPSVLAVGLRVTDDGGLTDEVTTSINITNVAPTMQLNPVAAINENGIATVTGTISDPGTLDTFTLDVDWGDPLSPNNTETYFFDASLTGSQAFTLTHQYLDDNPAGTPQDTYTIRVGVADDDSIGTLFESATLGGNGSLLRLGIGPNQFLGVRFQVASTTTVSRIGLNQMNGSGEIFGAIVQLSGPTDSPDSSDLSTTDLVGSTLISVDAAQGEYGADLQTVLEPGWYALLFGSGLFGATGSGEAPGNDTDIGAPSYFFRDGAGNYLNGTDSIRYFVDGFVDILGNGSSTTVTVNNVAPVAADQSYTILEDTPITFNVLAGTDDTGPFAVTDPGTLDTHTAVAGTFATTAGGSVTIAVGGLATYTPATGFAGQDSFSFTVEDDDGGSGTATVTVTVRNLVDLSGRVFDDRDNDGLFNGSDVGLENVTVELFNETNLVTSIATETTDVDGRYTFDANLLPGQYRIVEMQPVGLLDGNETAGDLGGTVDNTQDSDAISNIIVTSGDPDADGYNFADIQPSRIQGLVWEDFNDDGEVNFGEMAIEAVAIALSGTDDRGNAFMEVMNTDSQGIFEFINLRPSNAGGYTLTETQPVGFVDGKEALGTVGGVLSGLAADNVFSQIGMNVPGSDAMDYNFGERPEAGGTVQAGQAATIGFWQNKNGQNLVKSLNGGESSTQLGNWLATTFPNMYGASAGPNNLTGLNNAEVAGVFKSLFKRNRKTAAADGPPKLDAQVMATAFAVYVTNQTLAGTTAADFGFLVTEHGIGASTFNIGQNGAAFDVVDNTELTVLDILLKTDERTSDGLLFDLNDDDAIDDFELTLRLMANLVYTDINEQGDI